MTPVFSFSLHRRSHIGNKKILFMAFLRRWEERQQLQLALAGFDREDIEVALERKVLNISVQTSMTDNVEYVHKGIAQRSFSRNWQLSDDTVIDEVTFIDGLLRVTLRREVPEEDKRRILPISA